MNSNQIEKKIVLKAPLERVWSAISESKKFGAWFGVEFDGPFVVNSPMTGRVTPTQVDADVAKLQEPHKGKPFHIFIVEIVPLKRMSFRWHPFAIDPNFDYSREPMTLVLFEMSEVEGGTLLTITETGFDELPFERRDQAFHANDGGWSHQTKLIEKYLALANHMS